MDIYVVDRKEGAHLLLGLQSEVLCATVVSKYEVVVAGHLCADLIPFFSQEGTASLCEMVQPGKLNQVGPLQISTGGVVSNTGVALIKLGAETKLMGKVGQDQLGMAIIDHLRHYSTDVESMVQAGENTSYTIVLSPASTDRVFFHYPGCNATFTLDDIDETIVADARLMHFGYPTLMQAMYEDQGRGFIRLLQAVKEHKVTISLDLAMPAPDSAALLEDWTLILAQALPYVDVFLPSFEESLLLLQPGKYRRYLSLSTAEKEKMIKTLACELADQFVQFGASIVGIKCGVLGYHVQTNPVIDATKIGKGAPRDPASWSNRKLWCASYKADKFVSATGAGDCSIAGFLKGLLSGCNLEQTVNAACAVGAQNVRALDATSGVGTWSETLEMINEERQRFSIRLGEAWVYDPQGKVWVTD